MFENELPEGITLDGGPLIIRRAVLMGEGTWNNVYYSRNEIEKAFKATDWSQKENKNIFLDHKDYEAGEWLGEVSNPYFKTDKLYGDLVIYDPSWAFKLKHGKPKVGISPKVQGDYDKENGALRNYTYKNFSLVINPAVKTAWINNMEVLKMENNIEEVLEQDAEEEIKKKKKPEDEEEEVMKKKKEDYPYPQKNAEQDILSAAKEILRKKKKEEEEMNTSEEKLESIFDLFEIYELKKKSISEIVKTAKKIRKEGEPWKAAIKRAAKLQDEEEPDEEEDKPDEKPEKPNTEPGTPAEESKMQEIKEMKKKIQSLSAALSEPDVAKVKKVGSVVIENTDDGFLKYLQNMDREGEI